MELATPEWLNNDFIQKVLRNSENDDSLEVKNITAKPATAKGDNYTSEMLRVAVEYSRNKNGNRITEKRSLIVKISPTFEGVHKDMVGLFDTEIQMMETTLREMNSMVNDDGYRLGGNVLFTQKGDPSLLVIEDLAPLGYRMADRQSGLDLQHCIFAMRGLAKFHASSVAVCEKDPKHKLPYKKGIFHTDHPKEMTKFFVDGMKTLGTEVANWKEFGHSASSYADKITKLADVCFAKASECTDISDDEFSVINHGDFWVNNMLFRYNDEGKVCDHIFVDFQLCVYASPAIDLQYFLNTSPSNEVDLYHRDALLEEYLNTLTRTMSKLGCKTTPPSMEKLKMSMRKREFYGILAGCTVLPLLLLDKSEAKSLDEIMQQDGGYDNPAYKGPLFRKVMIRKIPEWNSRGLLDA